MKNKSGRHKEANTFTFQPFAERISNIDVDIFHRIGHKYEETDDEVSCYFRQTLVKWGALNLTNGFSKFRKEVSGVVSLAQLLHDKDRIVESLLTNISYKDPLYLQPLLELVIALAKDLRKEFYPYYIKFLDQLIDVLNTKDTDILEWTFQCLAYIFKFLWRYLIKDIHNVLSSLLPLLDNSKPDYVNNFAAESFAFVARKVHDRKLFLISILKLLKHKPEAIPGCGRLLFEVINGVQGQFHNCAEEILPFYFQSFSEEKCSQKVLFKLLEQVIFNITEYINPKKISLYWTSVLNVLKQFHDQWSNRDKSERNVTNIELLLTLIGQSIEYKEGKMLTNSELLVDRLINLLNDNISDGISTKISQIGALLLLYTQISLSQENTSRLTNRILLIPSKPTVMEFIKNVIACYSFEALILPTFLEYCVVEKLNQQVLHILTRIILQKSPIRLNGFSEWKPYVIDFPVSKQIAFEYETSQILIDLLDINLLPEKLDDVICALFCIPHVKNVDKSKCAEKVFTMITNLCNKINGNNLNRNELIELFFTLLICVDTLRNVSDNMDNCLDIILKTVTPYVTDYKFLSALRILDIVLSGCNDKLITNELLNKISEILIPNVSSQFHEVRLLTTHIFSLFENLQELNSIKTENNDTWKIFSICFDVESIEPNVSTYREQLKNLSHLNFDKPQATLYKDTDFKTYPLRYLLGVLYMNFKLLWKPTIEIISSQASGMPLFDDFWQVFLNQLHVALNNIENVPDTTTMANSNITCDFVSDLYTKINVINDKTDYHNYRLLLWNCMGEFPDLAHTKNRDVTTLFINFVNNEYLLSNSELAKSWNIQKHEINANLESTMNEDENEENAGEDELDTVIKFSRKATKSTLLAQLEVFSRMHNPKNMHREPELYQIYLELLMNRNSDIQKAALDCIMTYKHKYLTPHKEHLYNLINDKQLKNELALFRIDTDSEVLIKDHRKDFIPIVLRIVYSKMITKTGLRTGGKGGGQLKRSLILRFLSGCHEDELMLFVQMAFKYYSPFLRDNCDQIIADIDKNLDLKHTIAPKKLLSTINLLGIILEKFGAAGSKQLLPYLLRILLCVGGLLKSMFSRQEEIHAGYFNSLRQLRSSSIQIIARFFEHFEMYPWTKLEIDAVFDVFVWPWLDKLQIEGIHSPTALMKLFMCWSQNPRYFILLAKHLPDKPEQYAIPHILKLFLNPKTHMSVINAIVEILEQLLTLQPSEEEMASPQIPVDCYVKANKEILDRLKLKERLNFGSIIILTHVPSILQYLQNKIEKQKNFHKKELVILSRVSELVWEVETSDNLLKILLPILVKKASNASEDTVIQMVTTLCNLIQNVPNPIRHLKAVAPLFGEISTVPPRKLLCEFLQDLTQNCTDESIAKAKVVVELNAWDAKWIDQPDFTRRINAFRTISSLIEEGDLEYEFGVIIIHNCFYLIKYENDISLRDNASDCLKKLSLYLATKYKSPQQTEFVINDTILSLIRNGIRDKNDKVRNESISLLGYIARESLPQTYNVLTDLAILTNKVDLEVDFFENLQHLQLHRHVRALLKFSQIAKTLTKPFSSRTLTQFVLPLITQYLCCDKYLQKNTIVDAAIEAVGSVCRMLPWYQYETILRYYLGKLRNKIEYQKQLVRIIVAILDAFHFDLSRAKDIPKIEKVEIPKDTEEYDKEESEMEGKQESGEEEKEEQLEELLQAESSEDHEIVEEMHEKELTVFEKQTILAPSAARRLIYSITTGLLPQLNRAISQMKQSEHSHKLNKKRTGAEKEEDDILRVPIGLAVVKLLQKLPENLLEQNLPGIFMKICTFLKSHLESVRRITREILEKIMTSLGPQYLNTLLNVVTPLMTRGFQVHVLVYTVHGVLNSLKPFYKPGDLDKCLKTVLDLCIGDIFGIVAEEKEVDNIVNKTSEAKSTKSYDTFQILAQFITKTHLTELILPLKDILSTSFTYKKVRKAEECLRRIVLGVIDNKFITAEELVQFSFDVTSESIPELKCVEKPTLSKKEKELQARQKPDCFIIPLAPKSRFGEVRNAVKQSANSNAHVLIEFGLQLCYFLLKRERLKELDYRQRMDPFVILMLNSLKSKHVKLSTLTLNCLCWVFKMDLPALKDNVKEFAKEIFNLLHKYAVAGLSKGDNFDLVLIAFKAMGVLVRDVKYFILDVDQLKTLLLYTEQDLHDHDRQATAFSLLKAIISRKFIAPEIHDVMQKVAKISIISEMDHVRQQARNVFHQFLMDYPLGKKLEKYITFYLSQLNYELDFGRLSALDMILSLIQSFPLEVLNEQSPVFFVTLGARLINDNSPECKKAAAHCIKTMLERLERKERDTLMDVIVTWFQDEEQISHRQLAAQLCGLMVTVEKDNFESRLDNLIPILLLQFAPGLRLNEPGRFVRVRYENDTNFADEDIQRMRDHHLFQVLQLLLKLCVACPKFLTRTEQIEDFAKYAQSFLGYDHQWVRLAAAQFISFVMNVLKTDHIAKLYIKNKSEPGYLSSMPREDIKSLTLDLCAQLQVDNVNEQIVEQAVKNLIFIARILKKLPLTKDSLKDEDDEDENENENISSNQRINLMWLVRRLRKVVFAEISQTPTVNILRQAVFRWIGGLTRMLTADQITPILHHLLAPLVRELATEEASADIKLLAKEVSNELKRIVGSNVYTETVSKVQMKLNIKRAERKRERLQMAITDPERVAKKKIKFQAKKRELKKRKMAEMRGKQYIKTKKRKVVDLEEA